jgi:hypothetical protein
MIPVAFGRLPDRDLGRPAGPAHQLPGALDRAADADQLADQRLDPAEGPALVPGEPVRQRPLPQFGLQPGPLLRAQPSRDTGPLDRSAAVPPSCQARRQRRTGPSVTRRSRAISLIVPSRANRSAASSRSRSRRCRPAGLYPPRCAYRMYWSYAHSQPTSPPKLYEFILVYDVPGGRSCWGDRGGEKGVLPGFSPSFSRGVLPASCRVRAKKAPVLRLLPQK